MVFETCPSVKRSKADGGFYRFDSLKLFCVGDAARFARALVILTPDLSVSSVSREEANTVLSVASVFAAREEYCYIRITENGIEIRARDAMGARNAAAIIAQIIRKEGDHFVLPTGTLEDYPDAPYRAMMLESSGRSWISLEALYRYVYEMGLSRMNVLQFHFMEDPGCTIALDCYPEWHGFGKDNLKYTKDEIRALIAYADELGISITPFVEVISHTTDFNKVADIACPGDKEENMYAVCVGQEKTFDAIERVLTEVAELFPDPVLHIGGDEYDLSAVTPYKAHWLECPICQKMMKEKGFTTLREVFHYAVMRVNRIVNKLGKVSMLWNADVEPGKIPPEMERNMVFHFYRSDYSLGSENLYCLHPNGYVEDGFPVLNSHFHDTYMDFARYYNPDKLAEWSYLDTPRILPENRASVIGGCCCAWEEHSHFVRTISPSIFLFADRLWNADKPTRYDDAFGRLLTRLLFDGKLPEGMNAFRAVGHVLPPCDDEELLYARRLNVPSSEMEEIRTAMQALAKGGHLLANAFLPICDLAVKVMKEKEATTSPRTDRVQFDG